MFKEIKPEEITSNVFSMIGKQWMLISAGKEGHFNSMTASWGGLGVLWRRPVAHCYIRHSRHTFSFAEQSDYFTLTFLKDGYRDALNVMGTKSGRDCDKVKASGLTPVFLDGQPSYEEAEYILVCKKIYTHEITPEQFCDADARAVYDDDDFHKAYIGQIVKVYKAE